MFLIVFVSFLEIVAGDYDCVCSYSVERPVYSQPDPSNSVVGYMYEFDCKEYLQIQSKQSWLSIAINHKVGYVYFDSDAQITVCSGQAPDFDKITTTKTTTALSTAPTTATPTTTAPTTTTPTTTILSTASTSTFQPTDKSTMSQPATETSSTTLPTTTTTTSTSSPQHTTIPSTAIMINSTGTLTLNVTIPTHSSSTVTYTNVTTVQSTVSKQPSTESTTMATSPSTTVPTTQPTTPMVSTTVETSQAQKLCPKNVQQALSRDQGILILDAVHRKCFELVELHTSWFSAFSHCRQLGGKLVTIRSLDQNELLHAHVLRNFMHKTWIGLNYMRSTGQYRWSSGESITYTNWVEGSAQASTSSGSCIVIEPMTGMWQGENCYWSFPYVCEFDIPREMGLVG